MEYLSGSPNDLLQAALEVQRKGNFVNAIVIYNQLINVDPYNEMVIYLLSGCFVQIKQFGLAIHLVENNIRNATIHKIPMLVILGAAYRNLEMIDKAKQTWELALQLCDDPKYSKEGVGYLYDIYNNMSGIYADSCDPKEALYWANKALAINPTEPHGLWHKSLALLTLGNYDEGFDLYEARLIKGGFDTRPNVKAVYLTSPVPTNGESIYIHGEQGLGDEIMFLSLLRPFLDNTRFSKITLEVNEKLEKLVKYNFPDIEVITKEPECCEYDYKIALGSLQRSIFETWTKGRTGEVYLKVDPIDVEAVKQKLKLYGSKPVIGYSWLGGTRETRTIARSFNLSCYGKFLKLGTNISLQYDHHIKPVLDKERSENRVLRLTDGSCGADLYEQACYALACDLVLTCQQSLVHLCGAIGANTHAFVPKNAHWRYGLSGDKLPWYSNKLVIHRLGDNETWGQLIDDYYKEYTK